jgi:hypothetical protein
VKARRSPLAVALPLLVIAVQVVSAYVVLGTPDVAAARDFLTGTLPSMAGSVAAAQLVLWVALAIAFAAALVAALTTTVSAVQSAGRNAVWSVTVVAIGALILLAGANHRSTSGDVHLTGGSLQEARAQVGR